MLAKKFIRISKSPYSANLHAVSKPDGTHRWCVDYRQLNAITIKDKLSLPLISESLNLLGQSRQFTRLDLRSAFNQILMDDDSCEKTAFITRTGLYECCVMPFGLTNAPATFMRVINAALHGLLDVICIVYLDDIIIFSPDPSTHVADVRRVLGRLIEHNLFVKAEKCEFSVLSTKFLGPVSPEGVSMDNAQVSAITSYPPPSCQKELSRFLGFANAYRRYIPNFASLTLPLNSLLRKSAANTSPFFDLYIAAFRRLCSAFASPVVLRHFSPPCQPNLKPTRLGLPLPPSSLNNMLTACVLLATGHAKCLTLNEDTALETANFSPLSSPSATGRLSSSRVTRPSPSTLTTKPSNTSKRPSTYFPATYDGPRT